MLHPKPNAALLLWIAISACSNVVAVAQVPSNQAPSPSPSVAPSHSFAAIDAGIAKLPSFPGIFEERNERGSQEPETIADGDRWSAQLMPHGLLYGSYLAGPREPRFGYEWVYDTRRDQLLNEVTLGGRVGILRFGSHHLQSPEGWQIDIEGAAFPRLAASSLDLTAADFRFGLPLTWRRGAYQAKLAYYHLSSHAGDEFLLSSGPSFKRINFSRNAVVLGVGFFPKPDFRLYGEVGYGFLIDGGNQPWEFQLGAEQRPTPPGGIHGAPFWAVNACLRQEADFGGTVTAQVGWAWTGLNTSHLLRIGLQYSTGASRQLEFLGRNEELVGMGIWFDY